MNNISLNGIQAGIIFSSETGNLLCHLSCHGSTRIDVILSLADTACHVIFHGIKALQGTLAGGINGCFQHLTHLLQLVFNIILKVFFVLSGKRFKGFQCRAFLICNLSHGSIVGLSILIFQLCNAIGDGILNGGQSTAVIRALLCQPTGKLLYSGSPLLQFTTETGNLGGKIILKIFHTNICVIL